MSPGKVDIMQTYNTGVAFADNDAKCATKGDSPGCFMSAGQRSRFEMMLLDEIQSAQTNYKLALFELKVDKLVEKDDDLNWVASMILDLATSHLSTVFSGALKGLKGKAISGPEELGLGLDVEIAEPPSKWAQMATSAIDKVSDKSIETATKTGFDLGKKKAQKVGKKTQNERADTEKTATISYIDQLKAEADIGFKRFKDNLLATASDAELVVVYRGFAPEYQSDAQYKAALSAKIDRFKKSGVPEIGQHAIGPAESHVATVFGNKRCVWLLDESGNKALWFYHVLSGNQTNPWENGRDPDIEKVPVEFAEAALAKSEEKWGETPTFEHPAVGIMRRMGVHEAGKQAAQRAQVVASKDPLPRLDLGTTKPPSVPIQKGRP